MQNQKKKKLQKYVYPKTKHKINNNQRTKNNKAIFMYKYKIKRL